MRASDVFEVPLFRPNRQGTQTSTPGEAFPAGRLSPARKRPAFLTVLEKQAIQAVELPAVQEISPHPQSVSDVWQVLLKVQLSSVEQLSVPQLLNEHESVAHVSEVLQVLDAVQVLVAVQVFVPQILLCEHCSVLLVVHVFVAVQLFPVVQVFVPHVFDVVQVSGPHVSTVHASTVQESTPAPQLAACAAPPSCAAVPTITPAINRTNQRRDIGDSRCIRSSASAFFSSNNNSEKACLSIFCPLSSGWHSHNKISNAFPLTNAERLCEPDGPIRS